MKKNAGFTLIELMVAVVIIAILASVAYPAYQDSVRKGRRVDAKVALMEAAQIMERYFTENMTYATAPTTLIPATSTNGDYAVSLVTNTASSFQLKAVPSSTRQTGDPCGTYTLDGAGNKDVTGGTLTKSACW
jgi:type IV pilus assembly protein PilE